MTLPTLPPQGSTDWYAHYTALDAAVRGGSGVNSVNGQTGIVTLDATDVGARPATYKPSIADLPPGSVLAVYKDTVSGFWPSGYDASGVPSYAGGSASGGQRPTPRTDITVEWVGADPSPASVTSGTGGMLSGRDRRYIPG